MGWRKPWVYAIAGWSGFYVMVVELLGGRLISPFFGSSVYVWGSVIFVFMLALSAGYLAGGAFSRHAPSLARLCGILIASAVATVPIILFGDRVLNYIFAQDLDPRYGSLSACFLLFTIPTILCGMVSPYAICIVAGERESIGRDAGNLYFISTLGSSAGTLLTSFYFVLWFNVNTILMSAIAISAVLAASCLVFDRLTRSGVRDAA